LKDDFDAKVKVEVQQPHDAAIVDLNVKYVAALDRALQTAQQAGNLEDAVAIKGEKEAVAFGKGVPATDEEKTRPTMQQLRATYRSALTRIQAESAKKLQPLQAIFEKSLDALITSLTKAGKLEEAMAVKKQRDALAVAAPVPKVLGQPPGIPSAGSNSTTGTKESPFVNSLGMRFVPVPGTEVLMCTHETRKADYAAYAETSGNTVNASWQSIRHEGVPVSDGDAHPVVNVDWKDAGAFCEWLSKKEGRTYRLPTDEEWSAAVGVGPKEQAKGSTPESLSAKAKEEFPWGKKWPPAKKEENLADTSWKERFPKQGSIEGYTDGFATTAPVMSLAANNLGICDLGGNVWEWCQDWYNETQQERVARGGCWGIHDSKFVMSSFRSHFKPDRRDPFGGFRCVLVK
jgi:formylglycine-generating enzyme required for sulfatase activity